MEMMHGTFGNVHFYGPVKSAHQLMRQCNEQELVIDKAKDLLIELRKDIELTIHNNKVVNNSRVVALAEAKLQRIDEILNWKGDEQ